MDMNYLSVDLPKATMQKGYHYEGVLFWDYVVPNLGTTQNSGSNKRFTRVLSDNETRIEQDAPPRGDGVDWQLAFWITIALTLLGVIAAGITGVVVVMRRRSWSCRSSSCPCCRKKKTEEEALLASMKHADSYATFY